VQSSKLKIFIQLIFLVAFVIGAFYLAKVAESNNEVKMLVGNYGYLGVYTVSFFSGFNLVVPIPAIALMPLFLESGLNFYAVITLITLGMVTADSIAYLFGRFGKKILAATNQNSKILEKISATRERHKHSPLILMFLFASFIPLPNEIILIPLGILGYKYRDILLVLVSGNLIFNIIYSKGIINLFSIF
jgi:membrane protein DedA with SNARE-associated domain